MVRAIEIASGKVATPGLEIEDVKFHLTEFVDDEANENSWEWWIEPECCDLELLEMGPSEALDNPSDLVIAELDKNASVY